MPSGWHHTVENLADALSINHNWVNGHSLGRAWALLQRERGDAAAAIEDCRCAHGWIAALFRWPTRGAPGALE